MYDLETRRIIVRRSARFDETSFPFLDGRKPASETALPGTLSLSFPSKNRVQILPVLTRQHQLSRRTAQSALPLT